jgi:hypothetical protein
VLRRAEVFSGYFAGRKDYEEMVRQTIRSEKTARSDEDRASAFLSTTAAAC